MLQRPLSMLMSPGNFFRPKAGGGAGGGAGNGQSFTTDLSAVSEDIEQVPPPSSNRRPAPLTLEIPDSDGEVDAARTPKGCGSAKAAKSPRHPGNPPTSSKRARPAHVAESPAPPAGGYPPSTPSGRLVARLDVRVAELEGKLAEMVKNESKHLQRIEELEKEVERYRHAEIRSAARASSGAATVPTSAPRARSEKRKHQEVTEAAAAAATEEDSGEEVKIENLPSGTTSKSLLAIVEGMGRVASIKVTKRACGGALTGYVKFKTKADALAAVEKLKAENMTASLGKLARGTPVSTMGKTLGRTQEPPAKRWRG